MSGDRKASRGSPPASQREGHPSLYDPAAFDRIRADPNRTRWLSSLTLDTTDPIQAARVAELRLWLKDDQAALEATTGHTHPLPMSLYARASYFLGDPTTSNSLIDRVLLHTTSQADPILIEARLLALETRSYHELYLRNDRETALTTTTQVLGFAELLDMTDKAGVLETRIARFQTDLGRPKVAPLRSSGDNTRQAFYAISAIQANLMSGQHTDAATIAHERLDGDSAALLESMLHYAEGRSIAAAATLRAAPPYEELRMYWATHSLQVFAATGDQHRTRPNVAINSLLVDLEERAGAPMESSANLMEEELRRYTPLGLALVALLPDISRYVARPDLIPTLLDRVPRPAVVVDGASVAIVPPGVMTDIRLVENAGGMIEAAVRAGRGKDWSRYRERLERVGLRPHFVTTQRAIDRGRAALEAIGAL